MICLQPEEGVHRFHIVVLSHNVKCCFSCATSLSKQLQTIEFICATFHQTFDCLLMVRGKKCMYWGSSHRLPQAGLLIFLLHVDDGLDDSLEINLRVLGDILIECPMNELIGAVITVFLKHWHHRKLHPTRRAPTN